METIVASVDKGIARLILNRPDAGNSINSKMAVELREVAVRWRYDPDVRAVIISGTGKLFCGGGDLTEFAASDGAPQLLASVTTDFHAAISMISSMDAPVVAAVNGSAGGAGMSLMAVADLAIASDRSKFTMGYTKAGLVPDGGSSFYLGRVIGLRRAMELILTNRVLNADEALAWGLVNRVVPHDSVMAEAEALATDLAAGPTRTFGAAKRLVIKGADSALAEAMERESTTMAQIASTVDAHEGMEAFVGRRPPLFSGQ